MRINFALVVFSFTRKQSCKVAHPYSRNLPVPSTSMKMLTTVDWKVQKKNTLLARTKNQVNPLPLPNWPILAFLRLRYLLPTLGAVLPVLPSNQPFTAQTLPLAALAAVGTESQRACWKMPPNWRGGNERRYFRSGQIESWTTAALGNAAPEENRGLSPWLLSCGAGISEGELGLEKMVKWQESSRLLIFGNGVLDRACSGSKRICDFDF